MRSNMFGAVAVLALFAVAYGETTEETFTIDVKTAACNGYKLTSLKKEQAVSVFITDVGGSDSIKCSASANAAAMRVSELSLKQSDCAPNFKDDNLWGLTSKEITTESSTEPISSSDVSCTGDNTYLYFDNPCEEDRTVTVKVTYTPDANMKAICDFLCALTDCNSGLATTIIIVIAIGVAVAILGGVLCCCCCCSGCPLYKRRHANKAQQ